jgi:hypothetical protein
MPIWFLTNITHSALARGNDMIVVSVSQTHQKYRIYKDLIAYYSEYFCNALKKPWKEAEDRLIELPDIDPQVFDIFVDWLYTQKVPEKNRHWIKPTDDMKSNSTRHVQLVENLIVRTYVFADRFLAPKFRCAIYNHFAASLVKDAIPPYYEVIIFAFENLSEKSAMLDLLVRVHCAFWDESCDTETNGELELRKELPVDFFLRAMVVSSRMKDKEKARSLVECGCHREKATDREGCASCRPEEEKIEEEEEEGNTEGVDQAGADATAGADEDGAEADEADENEDGNGAAVGTTASSGGAQAADATTSSGGTQVPGATASTGAAQSASGAQSDDTAQPVTAPQNAEETTANDGTQTNDTTAPAVIAGGTAETAPTQEEPIAGSSSPASSSHTNRVHAEADQQRNTHARNNAGEQNDGQPTTSTIPTTDAGETTDDIDPQASGSAPTIASAQPASTAIRQTEEEGSIPAASASTATA